MDLTAFQKADLRYFIMLQEKWNGINNATKTLVQLLPEDFVGLQALAANNWKTDMRTGLNFKALKAGDGSRIGFT